MRKNPDLRADRFVERWRELKETGQRQYEAGKISDYKSTKSLMGGMVNSLQRDPQLESLLANRKKDLGISLDSSRSLGRELAFHHGLELVRGRQIEM